MNHDKQFKTWAIQKYLSVGYRGQYREAAICVKGSMKGSKLFFDDNSMGNTRLHIMEKNKEKRQVKQNEFLNDFDNDWIAYYERESKALAYDNIQYERHLEIMHKRMT